jgi:hypothetical protein
MREFIEALQKASDAMHQMSVCWEALPREKQDILNSFEEWGVAFNESLDDVPYTMWAIVDKLEEMGGK